MMIPPLVGNPYNGYIKSYYWIDEFIPPGTNGSSDPSTDAMGQRGSPLKIWSFQNCDGGNECCITVEKNVRLNHHHVTSP